LVRGFIGVEIRCEEMKRINIGNGERGDMVWIKLGNEKDSMGKEEEFERK